ncbi:outer membrane protein [Cognatiyoonia sp. IB215182]|uniref:outer membrane protein n=1 Tax=Cognatiyoonia sp. IB215182 TaxID=3097353 RepID=UPI002A24F087|nr:outer membrane beta-barrel protein [Cognatiyoonia sp. IB215182]
MLSLGSQTMAGGLSTIIEPAIETPPANTDDVDWSGLYLGGQASLPKVDARSLEDIGDGIAMGVHGGYLQDVGQLVIGAEVEVSLTAIESWSDDFPLSTIAAGHVRAGYDLGSFLPYVAVGVSQARLAGDVDETDNGTFARVGIDYRLTENLSVGGQYTHYRYDDFAGTGDDFDISATGARLSLHF